MFVQDWHTLAEQLIDKREATRVVHRYFNETTAEEEFGKEYLNELKRTCPEHADRINRLLAIPGIGAYITHWLLEQAGALCR
jgi:hypothetical protein